jgi:DNA-binding CsgD family transcriptional regulator
VIARKSVFSTSETAYAVDRKGQIVAWNEAAAHTFGYTESEALGQRCWELLSGRDIFGNLSCCEGCPIRATAFNNEPVNRFQIDFETAAHERKRFTVSTLMLFDGPGKEVLVHLCRPDLEVNENTVTNHTTNHSAVSIQRGTLTARETEVLTLLHQGKSVPEIAAAMDISVSTVRNHTQHVLLKLHVHTRFEAVALGRKLGLI